jgi:class 3 adenylate cyclase
MLGSGVQPSKAGEASEFPARPTVEPDGLLGVADLHALVDTARHLSSEVHMPRLLHRILEAATRLTDSPDGSVLLLDEARSGLYFADALGASAPMLLEQWGKTGAKKVPLIGSKAGQVFTSTTSVTVDSVPEDPNHFKGVDRATRSSTASMICVPLVVAHRHTGDAHALGVIQILNKRSGNYSIRDRLLLERFADLAAVSIDNARLVSDLFANKGLYSSDDDGADPQEILARPAWNEVLTVLIADMRGFTQLCQVIGRPERTQTLLNEFLGMLAEQVIAHHGVVNKFLGDGLMAFFRNKTAGADAVACAFAMLRAFDAMKERWNGDSNVKLQFLDLGVGISTEDVILGAVGNDRVWDFTAIGTGVNLAAHLMEHARGGRRLYVDKVTFRSARHLLGGFEGPEEFDLRKQGQTVSHPYERYLLLPPSAPQDAGAKGAAIEAARVGSLFVSYSHRDDAWRQLLRTHLQPYVTAGSVEVWDDTAIEAGVQWREAIETAIQQAKVALFLVSPNLLASRFIQEEELAPLLRRARAREVKILWVPLVSSSYEETEFQHMQAAMNPAHPLDTLSEPQQHRWMVDLCRAIKASM